MAKKPSRWCARCRKVHDGECPEKKSWRRTVRTEGKTTTERGYGAAWRKLRQKIIERDNGLCQPCLRNGLVKPFHAVDHIIPKSQGGTDDESNLQCICNDCHKEKTQQESNIGRGGKFSTGQK